MNDRQASAELVKIARMVSGGGIEDVADEGKQQDYREEIQKLVENSRGKIRAPPQELREIADRYGVDIESAASDFEDEAIEKNHEREVYLEALRDLFHETGADYEVDLGKLRHLADRYGESFEDAKEDYKTVVESRGDLFQ